MNRCHSAFAVAVVAAGLAGPADAASVVIESLDVRGTGVFGIGEDEPGLYFNHETNVSGVTLNGAAVPGAARTPADPIDVQLTYSNLDLDGDSTANDAVTFTMRWMKVDFDGDGLDGGFLASWGQGIDTGFGNLNDLELSIIDVSGTTTDSGTAILFDGFIGANLGSGGNPIGVDRTAEVNGTTITFAEPTTGQFEFYQDGLDFAPTPTVTFDNSSDTDFDGLGDGGAGSIVARSYDLQFSTESVGGLSADFNQDGTVDLLDLDVLGANWQMAGTPTTGDANGDGTVDLLDLDLLGSQWQQSASFESALAASGIAVPEPAALTLLALGSLMVARRRR